MTKQKLFLTIGLFAVLGFMMAPSAAVAGAPQDEICDNGVDDDGDKAVDCDDSDCSSNPACKEVPPKEALCHNIGGPDAKGGGANCDPDTEDPCCIETDEIGELCISGTQFFGIVIGASDNAAEAHIRHGDGPATLIFDPTLHLSSDGQNHHGANVECLGDRVNEQPPEPGN